MYKVIAGTGHRPPRLGGYKQAVQFRLELLARTWLRSLRPSKPAKVISGMALGWDQALARAAISLDIPVLAAVPFPDYHKAWPKHVIDEFLVLIDQCDDLVYVSKAYTGPSVMQKRNEWMVDRCDTLLALWDGSPKSGTGNCIRYAEQKGIPVENLWDRYRQCG